MQLHGLKASIELHHVLGEARDIASKTDGPYHSGHLLLALLLIENRAKTVLDDRIPDLNTLIDELRAADEPVDAITVVYNKTASFADSAGAKLVGTLHLLAGLCRVPRSRAFKALEAVGVRPSELRTHVIRLLTGGMKRKYLVPSAIPHADRVDTGRHSALVDVEPEPSRLAQPVAVAEPEPEVEPRPQRQPEPRPLPVAFISDSDETEADDESGRYSLDPDTFPLLTQLGRNLTALAEDGRLDPLVGRDREVEQLVDILNKRQSNNPCLIGDPGVGKTAIAEGLAQRIVKQDAQVGALGEKVLVELQVGSLVAGTQLRGAFAERLADLKREVVQAEGRVVLFIDELHTLIGAGAGDGPLDAANDLKTALVQGEFPCIGATTEREYRRYIESDPALERRFQMVLVDEPSPDEALEILRGLAPAYEKHHRVTYRDDALQAAVSLSSRWIHERFLPAKAVDVLDLAGAYASRTESQYVSADAVARVVAQQVGVPEERLLCSDVERLLAMETYLQERIIAHDEACGRMAKVIRRNFAGFTTARPMGSFLLLGPTGVGKTESARVLADFLFGSREALTRIDMSEYMDTHSVSRLIGAPPGYVGHEDGGQLTEAVRRRPYQIVLFDEVEKASGDVLNILLQLLEEGQLTDGRGRRVRFQHTVVMMTSNLGHQAFDQSQNRRVGFAAEADASDAHDQAMELARKAFRPELWNRIDEKLVFRPLTIPDVRRVAALLLDDSRARLLAERKISYAANDERVIDHLIERGGYDIRHGARPMRRTISDLVEGLVADTILQRRLGAGAHLVLDVVDGELVILPS